MPHELGHECEGCGSTDEKIVCPECGGTMFYDWGSEGHHCENIHFKENGEIDHPKTLGYDGYK